MMAYHIMPIMPYDYGQVMVILCLLCLLSCLLLCLLLWSYYGHIMPIMDDYGQVIVILCLLCLLSCLLLCLLSWSYDGSHHAYYDDYGQVMVILCLLCLLSCLLLCLLSWSYDVHIMPIIDDYGQVMVILCLLCLLSCLSLCLLSWSYDVHIMPIIDDYGQVMVILCLLCLLSCILLCLLSWSYDVHIICIIGIVPRPFFHYRWHSFQMLQILSSFINLLVHSILNPLFSPFLGLVAHHTAHSMIPHHTISTEPNIVLSSGFNYSFIIASTLAHSCFLSIPHLPPTRQSTQHLNISYHAAILQNHRLVKTNSLPFI